MIKNRGYIPERVNTVSGLRMAPNELREVFEMHELKCTIQLAYPSLKSESSSGVRLNNDNVMDESLLNLDQAARLSSCSGPWCTIPTGASH